MGRLPYLKVESSGAESARRRLLSLGLFDYGREVLKEGSFVLLPLSGKADVEGGEVVLRDSVPVRRKPSSLKAALSGVLTENEISLIPSSYSVVGDIALLELPEELRPKRSAIGEAVLSVFPHINVVAMKVGAVDTEYRVPSFEVVAGQNRTRTVHVEHGCRFNVDVAEAYFTPRLGTERLRVANLVKDGERVLVLFAGVGPYPVIIAKKRRPCEVVAVELNPKAVSLMRENVVLNKVDVNVVEGDARAVTPALGLFDRVVMPLPKTAGDFLDVVFPAVKKGGVVHFYMFAGSASEAAKKVHDLTAGFGRKVGILASVECGSFNPSLSRFCVDFTVY
ncbi:tRNA (guanine(37)-N1)-methyltransferase Trm5b [uncultured archaeon]|nr:tRNA (guanine(37)-N1)-methyltransferase Trm5b [uncultured archaeon]